MAPSFLFHPVLARATPPQVLPKFASRAGPSTAGCRAATGSAKQGALSGRATITTVSAGHRASYEWEYSVDGGKTWVTAPTTLQAKTTIGGLAAGTTVLFRVKAVTKAGDGDWSQPVALLVK